MKAIFSEDCLVWWFEIKDIDGLTSGARLEECATYECTAYQKVKGQWQGRKVNQYPSIDVLEQLKQKAKAKI